MSSVHRVSRADSTTGPLSQDVRSFGASYAAGFDPYGRTGAPSIKGGGPPQKGTSSSTTEAESGTTRAE